MNEIVFTIPGKPQGKDRPRGFISSKAETVKLGRYELGTKVRKTVEMVSTKKTVRYENLIGLLARQQMKGKEPFTCPIEIWVDMYFPITKSWVKSKKQQAINGILAATIKPDGDNCLKAICDALNKVVWADDVLVINKHVRKYFSEGEPCVKVRIIPHFNLLTV